MTKKSDDPYLKGLRERLASELTRVDVAWRPASKNAGLGGGYISSVVTDGVEPSIEKLARICRANNLNFPYIILGIEMTDEQRRLLELTEADPERAQSLISLLDR